MTRTFDFPPLSARLRPLLLLLAAVAAVLVLASCGSDDETPSTTAAAADAGGSFPAVVDHKFGTTTVPSAPKRIAIVGLTEQDAVLALGYKPIATTEWYGDHPYAVWPWAQKALGTAKPTVLKNKDGFPFERIATLRPDLIIGTNSGMKQADYDKLSKIAPTIAGVKGSTDYFSQWDQQTLQVAKALGKEQEGRALIQRIKDDYAKVGAEHPDFKGKTVTFSQNAFYDGSLAVYQAGLNTEFLTYLGLVINPKLTPLATKPGVQVSVSAERLDVLDADAMVFATEQQSDIAKLQKVPTFKTLDAVRGNRVVFTDPTLSGAMYFMSPLSLPYVLEHLTPALQAALDGKSPQRLVGSSTGTATAE